jgi:hypothetical protein
LIDTTDVQHCASTAACMLDFQSEPRVRGSSSSDGRVETKLPKDVQQRGERPPAPSESEVRVAY